MVALGGDPSLPEAESERDRGALVRRLLRKRRGLDDTAADETTDALLAVGAFVRRFVILPSEASYVALSLFVLHTWAFDAAHATPYIVVESPEKQSGKTRLLEVLQQLCRGAIMSSSITAAALFQSAANGRPTLLIDEADAIFAGSSERSEALRGVLNAGNRPGSPVLRGGKEGAPISYDVFSPKVISGIATGKLPDTIKDRAIVVPIDRKLKSEPVERFIPRRLQEEIDKLRDQLSAWEQRHSEALLDYDLPEPLEKISDRLEEAWEALLGIADLAGENYPEQARAAAVELAGEGDTDATASHALLIALRGVFGDREKMWTSQLVAALNGDDALPFGSWNDGAGIKPVELARLLARYRVKSRGIRIGDKSLKGYRREWLESAWERYGAVLADTPDTSPYPSGIPGFSEPTHNAECDGKKTAANPPGKRDVSDVSAKSGPASPESENGALATPEQEALADRHRDIFEASS
jgi:hypothetical protein